MAPFLLTGVDTTWIPILIFMVPITMFVCGTIIAITAILKSKSPSRDNAQTRDEARTIQELHSQCNRLAERIEALETIIIEQEHQKEK